MEDLGTLERKIGSAAGTIASLFPRHGLFFGAGMLAAGIVDVLLLDGWGSFWLMLGWSFVFGLHFLIYKGVTASEEWVEERIERVSDRPWDSGHVEAIRSQPFGRSPYRTEGGAPSDQRAEARQRDAERKEASKDRKQR